MQEIADWLQKLGMSEYEQRFAENRIDFSVLPELTDQHLKDLGVALGDRVNTPPPKGGGFRLRLKAGSVRHAAD